MSNQIFDKFVRSEFSDEIYAALGRAITIAARFDASCKTLAALPIIKGATAAKSKLEESEFDEIFSEIKRKYVNLNRAIISLGLSGTVEEIMTKARECRNKLVHEAPLGGEAGFEHMGEEKSQQFIHYLEMLILPIIRGEVLVSAIISYSNSENISSYPFSKEYESRYINWIVERF